MNACIINVWGYTEILPRYVFLAAEQRGIFMSDEASKYPIFSWRRRQNNTALAKQ